MFAALWVLTFSCQKPSSGAVSYLQASEWMAQNEYDSALFQLKRAFAFGKEHPMQLVSDSDFYGLIDSAAYRPKIRSILQDFSQQDHAKMIRPEEAGEPIEVWGLIVDESNQKPIGNAAIELVHTDEKGLYFSEKSLWNPRIFAYLKSNIKGAFSVHTIRPGIYQDDEGKDVPPHIHFTIEVPGYRTFASEFTFEDDPVFKANQQSIEVPVAKLSNNQSNRYEVIIPLQKN